MSYRPFPLAGPDPALWCANPSEDGSGNWYVWNAAIFPPQPVYVGTMEECGSMADALAKAKPYG